MERQVADRLLQDHVGGVLVGAAGGEVRESDQRGGAAGDGTDGLRARRRDGNQNREGGERPPHGNAARPCAFGCRVSGPAAH
jgi:hypothetical protein